MAYAVIFIRAPSTDLSLSFNLHAFALWHLLTLFTRLPAIIQQVARNELGSPPYETLLRQLQPGERVRVRVF